MKKKTIRRVQGFFRIVCGLGFLFLLGTAGASDAGTITDSQLVIQLIIGLAMFAGGAFFGGMMG